MTPQTGPVTLDSSAITAVMLSLLVPTGLPAAHASVLAESGMHLVQHNASGEMVTQANLRRIEEAPVFRTELARVMWEHRKKLEAEGYCTLSVDEVLREIADRSGEPYED